MDSDGVSSGKYGRGLLFVVLAGICWSTQGVAVRLIGDATAWEILFVRSLALTMFLAAVLGSSSRGLLSSVRNAGTAGIAGGICLAIAYATGILAMQSTSIAGAVVLFATAPFFAAVLGVIFLGEPVRRSSWILMSIAFVGIVVMQGGDIAGSQFSGSLLAMTSAFFFSVFTIILRWRRNVDMLPCVFISGPIASGMSLAVIFAIGSEIRLDMDQMIIAAIMGVAQTGAGLVLYTIGSRVVPAVQLALLPLLEVVLSPLWVAIFLTEVPTALVLIGGTIVLAAVLCDAVVSAKSSSSRTSA